MLFRSDGYSFSVAGGGRYDEMIEKFSNVKTSAVGFSIGFERIVTILKDFSSQELKLCEGGVAFIIEKGVDMQRKMQAFKDAQGLREQGKTVTVQPMKKNVKFQLAELEKSGFTEFRKIYKD